MNFALRPPSTAWERLSLADSPQNCAWAWYKPVSVPSGLLLRIPDELYRDFPQLAAQWTIRRLVQAAGVEPASVASWSVNGAGYPGMNGASPYFDAPLPAPVAGIDPNIVVFLNPMSPGMSAPPPVSAAPLLNAVPVLSGMPVMGYAPGSPVPIGPLPVGVLPAAVFPVGNGPVDPARQLLPVPAPAPATAPLVPLDAATADIYERVEADWSSSNEIEKDLSRLRKQLVDILGRLKALNRELTPPERVHSNNQDKKDWQDARRGLRDATNRVWKYLKAHDIGDTSNAGKRVWFDEIYRKYIGPRVPFDGLMAAARAFESHRKTITQLHGDMSNAYSYASIDCERKAQQVIQRIQTKVREASNKKNFLGVMLDS